MVCNSTLIQEKKDIKQEVGGRKERENMQSREVKGKKLEEEATNI